MIELSGSMFIHNGVKFDYCFREAILSLHTLCDEVVVIDAESEDNTVDQLHKLKWDNNLIKLKIYTGYKWECNKELDKGYQRLAILANKAKELTTGEWHFMLQADEVLHESSIPYIRELIKSNKYDSYLLRRINLYYNVDNYIRYDCGPSTCGVGKPCSDLVWRLGIRYQDALGDAEQIAFNNGCTNNIEELIIFHYGYVRKPDILLDKANNMLDWFWRKGGHPDNILIEQKEKYGYFIPEQKMPESCYRKLEMSHPIFSKEWAEERRKIFSKLEEERGSKIKYRK